jgi:hypothetical protein
MLKYNPNKLKANKNKNESLGITDVVNTDPSWNRSTGVNYDGISFSIDLSIEVLPSIGTQDLSH